MTIPFLIDDSEFEKANSKVTPYEVLGDCQSLLEARGRLRDKDNNILENSLSQAAKIANSVFYADKEKIDELVIIEMLIALKLARISAAIKNGRRDVDSVMYLINYCAFFAAELRNNYE